MSQTIKNINQLTKVLESKIVSIIKLVAEDVKQEIDDYLQEYYDEYDPTVYRPRTDQLRDCCKIGTPKISNGKVGIEVYLDINSLNYTTPGVNPYKTVVAANAGLHGGWDISNLSAGQVPWSAISGNTGNKFGSGTQIWEEPMRELIKNGKLATIFKKCAKQRGLNLK